MSDFERFKDEVLSTSVPITQEDIDSMVDEMNTNAHKSNLFTEQFQSYLNDIPVFSVNVSKMFAINYIEQYHQWLIENFDIKPKN